MLVPMLREVPNEDATQLPWLGRLTRGDFDVVIFLTGVGCQALLTTAEQAGRVETVLAALADARVVARGPKPVNVLRRYGVRIDFVPPEPNTSDELLAEFSGWQLAGNAVGLQLYGGTTPFLERLRTGLAELGALVDEVAPYRWQGPANDRPVRDLIEACLTGGIDALAIMSSSQIQNLFAIADAYGQVEALRRSLNEPNVLVAAIGPVAAEAIESCGVRVDLQPGHPKMGYLIKALGDWFGGLGAPGP